MNPSMLAVAKVNFPEMIFNLMMGIPHVSKRLHPSANDGPAFAKNVGIQQPTLVTIDQDEADAKWARGE